MKNFIAKHYKDICVVACFAILAIAAVGYSRQTVSSVDSDEMTSILVESYKESPDLYPDAELVKNFDTGPYLYPKVLHAFYESMGRDDFKSINLFILIILNCVASYFAMRYLGYGAMISVVVALIAIFPRFSPGIDSVGVLTFKEAIGRSYAMPLAWIASAFVIKAIIQRKSTYLYLFGLGVLSFIHPVTAFLSAGALLVYLTIVNVKAYSLQNALGKVLGNFLAFLLGAFIVVKEIISVTVSQRSSENFDPQLYIDAVYFRNMWDFLPHSAKWLVHVGIVSFVFVLIIAIVMYICRRNPASFDRRTMHHALLLAGVAMALSLTIPNIQALLTEKFGTPFIFQQWSRVSKLYYIGLFIAFAAALKIFFEKYAYNRKQKVIACTLVMLIGALSSSFFFEIGQYAAGYANYEKSYVPASLIKDNAPLSEVDYKLLCRVLEEKGVQALDKVISNDFNLRYYCRFDLFVTHEEGTAWIYKDAPSVIRWRADVVLQDEALAGNIEKLTALAKETGSEAAIVPTGAFLPGAYEVVKYKIYDIILFRQIR